MKEMFKQMLTGAGSRFNGGNRWFDKTVQVRCEFVLVSVSFHINNSSKKNIIIIHYLVVDIRKPKESSSACCVS